MIPGDGGNRVSLNSRLLVRHQEQGSDSARAVTALAVLLENWKNILLESGRRERSRSRKYKRHAGTNHPFTSLHAVYLVL